jgi:hypothetical protein
MNDDDSFEPVDEDLARMVTREREARAPSEALRRVSSRLGLVGALPVPPRATSGPLPRGWLGSHVAAIAGGAFALGGVTGVAVYAAVRESPPPQIIYRDRAAPPRPAPSETAAPLPSAWPTAPTPVEVSPRVPPRATTTSHDSLQTERDALDHARELLSGGDAARALELLDAHAAHFAKPQLGEEREALAIQALVALRRYDEARARAKRFHEASPNSLFAPVIDAALGSIP